MVKDHSATNEKVESLAAAKNVTLPAGLRATARAVTGGEGADAKAFEKPIVPRSPT